MAIKYVDLSLGTTGGVGTEINPWGWDEFDTDTDISEGGIGPRTNSYKLRGTRVLTSSFFVKGTAYVDVGAWDVSTYGPWRMLDLTETYDVRFDSEGSTVDNGIIHCKYWELPGGNFLYLKSSLFGNNRNTNPTGTFTNCTFTGLNSVIFPWIFTGGVSVNMDGCIVQDTFIVLIGGNVVFNIDASIVGAISESGLWSAADAPPYIINTTDVIYNWGGAATPTFVDGDEADLAAFNAVDGFGVGAPGGWAFTVTPSILNVNPTSGVDIGGTSVTITGTDFKAAQGSGSVTFDGNPATINNWNDTSIICTTPSGTAGSVDVVVTNGDSNSDTDTNGFTYTASISITNVSPDNGPETGSTSVTITGTGFKSSQGGGSVTIGGASLTGISWSDTSISGTTPSGTIGAQDVVVTNSDTNSATDSGGFTYTVVPSITNTSPSNGPETGGTAVTLTGTGFEASQGGGTATIGGSSLTSVSWSDISITGNSPAGSIGAADVVVTNNSSNSDTDSGGFTFTAVPNITSIVPSAGPEVGGTSIAVNGTGFEASQGTGTVTVGGSSLSIVNWTDMTVLGTTPSGSVGSVDIVLTNNSGNSNTSSGGFTYQDTTEPVWSSTYPKSDVTKQKSASFKVQINETGNVYAVLVPSSDTIPTTTEVKAGQSSGGGSPVSSDSTAVTADTEATINFSGMTADTEYTAYFAGEDSIPNLMTTPAAITFTSDSIKKNLTATITVQTFFMEIAAPSFISSHSELSIPYTGNAIPTKTSVSLTTYEYSIDGGTTWSTMTATSGTVLTGMTFNAAGTSQTFVWKIRDDIGSQTYNTNILLRLIAQGGGKTSLTATYSMRFTKETTDESDAASNASPFPIDYSGQSGTTLLKDAPKT